MTKTIVALFDHFSDARRATVDLVAAGFDREDISLVANKTARDAALAAERDAGAVEGARGDVSVHDPAIEGASVGAAIGGVSGLLVGLAALAIPGIGPIVALGPLTAALAGAGVGAAAGGLIGALIDLGVPHHEARDYAEAIKRGDTLLTLRATAERAAEARGVLERHHPTHVGDHAVARARGGDVARTHPLRPVDMETPDLDVASRHMRPAAPASDVQHGAAWDSAAAHADDDEPQDAAARREYVRTQRVIVVGEEGEDKKR